MSHLKIIFDRIDDIAKRIRRHASEPEFSNEVQSREQVASYELVDNDVLRTMIELIAYSQGARADRINAMIDRGIFRDVFKSYEPTVVAAMDPNGIKQKHWDGKLSPMRFPDKIEKMVASAKSLGQIAKQHGSFMRHLQAFGFPKRIQSSSDIDTFWNAFQKTRLDMPPFFQNFISLCHLLQTFRLPCAKPDKVVMAVAAGLGIVNDRRQYPETELRNAVQTMQSYAADRKMSVPMVDLIFLIQGKQSWAKSLVRSSFYAG